MLRSYKLLTNKNVLRELQNLVNLIMLVKHEKTNFEKTILIRELNVEWLTFSALPLCFCLQFTGYCKLGCYSQISQVIFISVYLAYQFT